MSLNSRYSHLSQPSCSPLLFANKITLAFCLQGDFTTSILREGGNEMNSFIWSGGCAW